MSSFDTGPFGPRSAYQSAQDDPDGSHRHSAFSLAALIAVIAVAGALVLGLLFLIIGTLVSLAGAILKVVLIAAVAALVWRRICRRRRNCGHI